MKKSLDNKLLSLPDLRVSLVPRDVTMEVAEAKAQYPAILLGATGNVGGRIVQLLIKNPVCKKVVLVTRRKTDALADPQGLSQCGAIVRSRSYCRRER